MGNQEVEFGYRPRGTAKGASAQNFALRNEASVVQFQTNYQTPERKAAGWRSYTIELIKMFKCIQGVVDQAEFVVVECLSDPCVPPEAVMQSRHSERSKARIRASNLINMKVLLGSLIVSDPPNERSIAPPPLRLANPCLRRFEVISDSTLYGKMSRAYMTDEDVRDALGLPNCKVLPGKVGGTMSDLRKVVEAHVAANRSPQRVLPVLLVAWAGNDFDSGAAQWTKTKSKRRAEFQDDISFFRRLVDPSDPMYSYEGIIFLTPRDDSTFEQYRMVVGSVNVSEIRQATAYIEQYFPVLSTRAFVDSVSRYRTSWESGGRDQYSGWYDKYHYKKAAAQCVTEYMQIVARASEFLFPPFQWRFALERGEATLASCAICLDNEVMRLYTSNLSDDIVRTSR